MTDLDNNLNNLVKNIKIEQQFKLINKIKDWLIDVEKINEPNIDNLSDIDKGWSECAEMLLKQINEWEK